MPRKEVFYFRLAPGTGKVVTYFSSGSLSEDSQNERLGRLQDLSPVSDVGFLGVRFPAEEWGSASRLRPRKWSSGVIVAKAELSSDSAPVRL